MRFLPVVVLLLLAGCATPVVLLKNDATGETVRCGGLRLGEGQGLTPEEASTEACVRRNEALGFRRTSEGAEALKRTPTARQASASRSTPIVESRWLINAEALAKSNGCTTPLTTMTDKGPGTERFSATCADGRVLVVACDFEGCRLPR